MLSCHMFSQQHLVNGWFQSCCMEHSRNMQCVPCLRRFLRFLFNQETSHFLTKHWGGCKFPANHGQDDGLKVLLHLSFLCNICNPCLCWVFSAAPCLWQAVSWVSFLWWESWLAVPSWGTFSSPAMHIIWCSGTSMRLGGIWSTWFSSSFQNPAMSGQVFGQVLAPVRWIQVQQHKAPCEVPAKSWAPQAVRLYANQMTWRIENEPGCPGPVENPPKKERN